LRSLAVVTLIAMIGLNADNRSTHYPPTYNEIITAAHQEKKLVIYSVVHADVAVRDLLAAFHRRYPFVEIMNSDDDGARTYQRFKREIAANKPSADFIWSSAMDLQE
jgi:iron(III) transport system substrate-binding protein